MKFKTLAGIILTTAAIGASTLGLTDCSKSKTPLLEGDYSNRHYVIYPQGPRGTRTEVSQTNGVRATYYDQDGGIARNIFWLDHVDKTTITKARHLGYVDRVDLVSQDGKTNIFKNNILDDKEPTEQIFINATKELENAALNLASNRTERTKKEIVGYVDLLKTQN